MHEQVADDWFIGFQTGLPARFWRAISEPFADDEAEAVHGVLGLSTGGRVLDAPCGAGRIAVRLAGRGLEVTGIDISAHEVDEARRVALEGADFRVSDLLGDPIERSPFGIGSPRLVVVATAV